MKFILYFMAAHQSASYSTFSQLAVKTVEHPSDWSERINKLAIPLFFTVSSEKSGIAC